MTGLAGRVAAKSNLKRVAEEAKSAQIKKPKTSRGKRADEML